MSVTCVATLDELAEALSRHAVCHRKRVADDPLDPFLELRRALDSLELGLSELQGLGLGMDKGVGSVPQERFTG